VFFIDQTPSITSDNGSAIANGHDPNARRQRCGGHFMFSISREERSKITLTDRITANENAAAGAR
jgi:hypothetical protein